MGYEVNFANGLQRVFDKASTLVLFRYYNKTIGSVYDDDVTLTLGSTLWTRGVVESLNKTEGSTDANLLEQGKIRDTDSKLYLHGSLVLTGSNSMFTVQIGSPTGEIYSLIPEGGIDHQVNGVPIFKAGYIRRLTTGSLFSA